MKVVRERADLAEALTTARAEAQAAFGDPMVYLEKYLAEPRHIEIQVLGDGKGRAIHLGERDCSLQRRHQKVWEESPSPAVNAEERDAIGERVAAAMRELNYLGAGTVEFLYEDGAFYFIEMNTRIQVEHPVTEMITGIDLVNEQIRIAAGGDLPVTQDEVRLMGHAIECRINAEDPFDDFRPSPGRVEMYYQPGGRGVRVDTHAYAGYNIPPHYDSMIGKLITYGKDRREAMDKMSRALGEYMITGVKTTIAFQQAILQDPNFRRGVYSTSFIEQLLSGARRELI
jgi:acetyl-CoA carboxylase biotin carboxylase subunit